MTLPIIALAWLLSMAAVALWGAPWWTVGALVIATLPLIVAGFGRQGTVVVLAAGRLALVGGWRFEQWELSNAPDIQRYVGGKIEIEGEIASEPDAGLTTASYEVAISHVTVGGERHPPDGSLRLRPRRRQLPPPLDAQRKRPLQRKGLPQ